MKKLIIIFTLMFGYLSTTYAGVVPGTIKKGTNSTSISCGTDTTDYPTGTQCSSVLTCNYGSSCSTCGSTCTATNASGSCISSSCNSCYLSSGGQNISYTYSTRNNYLNNPQVITYNGSVKLTNDTQTCNPRTTGISSDNGGSTAQGSCPSGTCGGGGTLNYYINPRHGYCSSATSVKTIISSYDQLGNRTYSYNNYETKVNNTTRNVNLTATCQIEGRYATADNTAPTASINGVSSVFANNDEQWCNIKKYRGDSPYGAYKADENPGCEYYRELNTTGNPTGNEDLLKGLEINVPGDVSGIGEVQVRIGTCSAKYTSNSSNVSTILVSPNSSSTTSVKDTYKNAFTIKYNEIVFALGEDQPSLLTAMGKTRLDQCLDEGKNSIAILIKDMARSTTDGVTPHSNVGAKFTKGTINIDNSTPNIQKTGDLDNSIDIWRNYSLLGNIESQEQYKIPGGTECTTFSGALTGECNGTLDGGQIWTAPSGVHATTGKFMQYTCDGLGPFPTNGQCEAGCPLGEILDLNTNTCSSNTCKAFVGGAEVVIEDGVNGVVNADGTCMGYCIAGHGVGCVVKGVEPTPEPTTGGGDIGENCPITTIDGYNLTNHQHNGSLLADKWVEITNGDMELEQNFWCNNTEWSKSGSEDIKRVRCDTGFVVSGDSCVGNTGGTIDTNTGTVTENEIWKCSWSGNTVTGSFSHESFDSNCNLTITAKNQFGWSNILKLAPGESDTDGNDRSISNTSQKINISSGSWICNIEYIDYLDVSTVSSWIFDENCNHTGQWKSTKYSNTTYGGTVSPGETKTFGDLWWQASGVTVKNTSYKIN